MNQTYLMPAAYFATQPFLSKQQYNYATLVVLFPEIESLTVDDFILKQQELLKDALVSLDIDLQLVRPLFAVEDQLRQHLTISVQTDLEILKGYHDYQLCEAGITFGKLMFDYFFISAKLRNVTIDCPFHGFISQEMKALITDLPTLLEQSRYDSMASQLLAGNRLEYYWDLILIENLKPYFHLAYGPDKIFAYCFFKLMELKNMRIILKGHEYHQEITTELRWLDV